MEFTSLEAETLLSSTSDLKLRQISFSDSATTDTDFEGSLISDEPCLLLTPNMLKSSSPNSEGVTAVSVWFELPDILDAVGLACCDAPVLARLACSSRSLATALLAARFAQRRAEDLVKHGLPWATNCRTLEELAVGFSATTLCSSPTKNQLYFPYGGGLELRPLSRPFLVSVAALARRHTALRIQIDGHTGASAPSGIATKVSAKRARFVARELIDLGISEDRISVAAWGRRVSSLWSEADDERAARAELFFLFEEREFPARASYYDLVPEAKRPAVRKPRQVEQLPHSESSDEEMSPRQRARQMIDILRLLGFPLNDSVRPGGAMTYRRNGSIPSPGLTTQLLSHHQENVDVSNPFE